MHYRVVLIVPAPPRVRDGLEGTRRAIRHRDGLDGAGAPFLEVDLLGFPPEESVRVRLDIVFGDCVRDLIEGADLDVSV